MRSNAHSNIDISTHMRSQIEISISSKIRVENFTYVMTMNITTKYMHGQLAVCNMEYCELICWTPCGMHCERFLQDPEHFYDMMKPALDKFLRLFCYLARLRTGSNLTVAKPLTANHATNTYCWCGGRDEGKMVACDNASCQRELMVPLSVCRSYS